MDTIFFAPALGLVLHEAIRFYKAIWSGLDLYPLQMPIAYISTIAALIAISIFVSEIMGVNGLFERASIGFGITTGIGILASRKDTVFIEDRAMDDERDAIGNREIQSSSISFRDFFWY